MADNIELNAGSGGSTVSTDDAGASGHVQRVKLAYSADGSATHILADADGLEVQGAGVAGTPAGGVVSVQGVASGTDLPVSNAGLTELAAAINGSRVDVNIAASAATLTVGSHAVTNAGTFATQVDGAALTALQLIDDPVFADDAAFTVGTSKVMMAGANAVAHGANPDAADAGDAVAIVANRHRVPFVIGGHPNPVTIEAAYTTAQTDTAIVTAGAGAKIVVTRCDLTLDEACTVGVGFRVGFGTANTPTTTGVVSSHPGMVPGGGLAKGDGGGMLGVGADNEDLRITSEVPTGGSLRVVATYYTVES